jgi:hypothetical protein
MTPGAGDVEGRVLPDGALATLQSSDAEVVHQHGPAWAGDTELALRRHLPARGLGRGAAGHEAEAPSTGRHGVAAQDAPDLVRGEP